MNIEALAKKAGMVTEWYSANASCVWTNGVAGVSTEQLTEFARLVAIEEREACEQHYMEWKNEGEELLEQKGLGAAFFLGRWWADRPWRKRSNAM